MRIVITTYGTLGDLLPYLALGQALRSTGHRVVFAVNSFLIDYVTRAGLEAKPCYPHFGPEEVRAGYAAFDHWPDSGGQPAASIFESRLARFDLDARVRDLLEACRGADLLIHHSNLTGERIVLEILGLPGVMAVVTPEKLWRPLDVPGLLEDVASGRANTHSEENRQGAHEFLDWHHLRRRRAGLPETPAGGWAGYFRAPTLLAVSPSILEPFDTSAWAAKICGFWFYQPPEWSSWQPDPELAAFMDRRPIVLSFSSQPVADPAHVVELHVAAARRMRRPILIQSGWAGLAGASDGDVLFRGFLPQDWIFARAACVIHHGGIGTIARAVRHGRPMLVEPYGNDQHFNALLVLKSGLGAAVHPKKVRAGELARVIEEKVLSEGTAHNASRIAGILARENGVEAAVREIERLGSP